MFFMQKIFTFIVVYIAIAFSALAQYSNVLCTGFNNDIVANGTGNNSIPGTSYPSIGMDGAGYTFIDNTYKYSASSTFPICFLPVNKQINSTRTPGLTYILQSYSGNNSMTIDNDNTAYLTSPFAKTGTLTLTNPASYTKLYVLYESVMYLSPMTVDVVVTFTDLTTQSFSGNSCVNWFTNTLPTYSGIGRTSPAGAVQCGLSPNFYPNLFELQLTLSASNITKQVQSINFTLPTVYTVGSTADKVNYFHALAIGGFTGPTGIVNESTNLISIHPNPTADYLYINGLNQYPLTGNVSIRSIDGRVVKELSLSEVQNETINLANMQEGLYFITIQSNKYQSSFKFLKQ